MKKIFFLLFLLLLINVSAQIPVLKLNETTNQTRSTYDSVFPLIEMQTPGNMSLNNVNSSDFWDNLDTPADFVDITLSGVLNLPNQAQITDGGGYTILSGNGSIWEGLDISIPQAAGSGFYYGYGGTEHHLFGASGQVEITDDGFIKAVNINRLGVINNTASNVSIYFRSDDITISGVDYSAGKIISGFTSTLYTDSYIGLDTVTDGEVYLRVLTATGDGRVGIGTISPTHELNVVGNANITGNITADWATLNNLNVTGTSYLGDVILSSDNMTVTNLLNKTSSGIKVWSDLNVTGDVFSDDNITADYFIGDGSYLYNVNVSADYAQYQFTSNNFNGTGNFTTIGDITIKKGSATATFPSDVEILSNSTYPTSNNIGLSVQYAGDMSSGSSFVSSFFENTLAKTNLDSSSDFYGLFGGSRTAVDIAETFKNYKFYGLNFEAVNKENVNAGAGFPNYRIYGADVTATLGWTGKTIDGSFYPMELYGTNIKVKTLGTLNADYLGVGDKIGSIYGTKITMTDGFSWTDGDFHTYGLHLTSMSGIGEGDSYAIYSISNVPSFFEGDIQLDSDTASIMFGENQDANITFDGTNLVFDYNATNPTAMAWFSGNLSAFSYDTRTSVFDKSRGNALDFIKDADDYKIGVSDEINHSIFYGYTTYQVKDPNNCSQELEWTRYCYTYNQTNLNGEYEVYCIFDYQIDKKDWQEHGIISEDIEEYYHTVCGTKTEEAVSLNKEIDVLRQATYELNQKVEQLETDYSELKNAFCVYHPEDKVCLGGSL